MNPPKYVRKLKELPFREVTIGWTTIYLFSEDELSKAQKGYSIDANGNSLVGTVDGDWKQSWLVIGNESLCGDPIFVDIDDEDFPVFTAAHGMGNWNANLIADNFESFVKSLEIVAKCKSMETCLEEIKLLNEKSDLEFWELLFED